MFEVFFRQTIPFVFKLPQERWKEPSGYSINLDQHQSKTDLRQNDAFITHSTCLPIPFCHLPTLTQFLPLLFDRLLQLLDKAVSCPLSRLEDPERLVDLPRIATLITNLSDCAQKICPFRTDRDQMTMSEGDKHLWHAYPFHSAYFLQLMASSL